MAVLHPAGAVTVPAAGHHLLIHPVRGVHMVAHLPGKVVIAAGQHLPCAPGPGMAIPSIMTAHPAIGNIPIAELQRKNWGAGFAVDMKFIIGMEIKVTTVRPIYQYLHVQHIDLYTEKVAFSGISLRGLDAERGKYESSRKL